MIASVEPLDCGYRDVGSLLRLLAISEIIPGLAGTLQNVSIYPLCLRKASFVYVGFSGTWRKELLIVAEFN